MAPKHYETNDAEMITGNKRAAIQNFILFLLSFTYCSQNNLVQSDHIKQRYSTLIGCNQSIVYENNFSFLYALKSKQKISYHK